MESLLDPAWSGLKMTRPPEDYERTPTEAVGFRSNMLPKNGIARQPACRRFFRVRKVKAGGLVIDEKHNGIGFRKKFEYRTVIICDYTDFAGTCK